MIKTELKTSTRVQNPSDTSFDQQAIAEQTMQEQQFKTRIETTAPPSKRSDDLENVGHVFGVFDKDAYLRELNQRMSPRKMQNSLSPERSQGSDIIERVVQPESTYKLKSMVAAVFQMRDKLDYEGAHKQDNREVCISSKSNLFDLEKSHLVNRPAVYKKEAK